MKKYKFDLNSQVNKDTAKKFKDAALFYLPYLPYNEIDFKKLEENGITYTKIEGLVISTVKIKDYDLYETAIIDNNYTSPVERYKTLEEAKKGHEKWVNDSVNLTFINSHSPLNSPFKKSIIDNSDLLELERDEQYY